MTDLSAKFSALQTNLGGKLDTIIGQLDTLNSNLTALRGTGPENTLRSINQSLWNLAGEAPGKTLTDLHTALRAAIGDNSVNTNSISALYNLLRTLQGTDITMSLTDLNQTEQGIATLLQTGLYYDQGSFTTPWLNILASYLANPENAGNLYDMVSNINTAIGGTPYESLELGTVRGFLNALMMGANNFGVIPDGSFTNVSGSSSTLTENDRRYVIWPSIAGTERFDANTRIERTTGNNWDDWELYVQTDSPDNAQFQTHLGVPELPTFLQITTNGWVDLDGPFGFRLSVDAQYQIRAYLRRPANHYVWEGDEIVLYQTIYGNRYRASVTKYPELIWGYFNDPNNPYLIKSLAGWQWSIMGGSPQVQYSTSNNFQGASSVSSATGTFPSQVQSAMIQSQSGRPSRIDLFFE